MKKATVYIGALLFLLLSLQAGAQTKTGTDYFAGKWNVLVKGLPQGDTKMIFVLDKKDSSLTGDLQDSTGKEIAKVDKVDIKGDMATLYFTAQGYDVNLVLNKKDDDHVTGSMMSMFDAEGERLKSTK